MEEKNEKMELIDFDDKFTQVLNDWVEKNQTKFANADEMEAAMPDVYLRFLNTPADWLGGKAPGNAFDDVSDAGELVAMMKRYIEEEIPVPDPLLATEAGLGNGETPIFPIQIFRVKEGVSFNPGDPNYDLSLPG